jgi:lipoprotein signal peptidase
MSSVMTIAFVIRGAFGDIVAGIFELALIDMIAVHMMQMAVMNIIDMVTVLDGGMTAIAAMLVVMI